MNLAEHALRAIARDLACAEQGWALVGGFAVSAWAEPRFTADIDVAVAVPNDLAAEKLTRSLMAEGYGLLAAVEPDASDRLATVRLVSSGLTSELLVDLLFASSGIEPEIVAAAKLLEVLPGLTVPVAQRGHLIAMKLLARDDQTRPLDLADLRALLHVATPDDLTLAREAIGLITERSFNRERDLAAALAELLR
jgi:predicted nucleotidyltransferase